MQRSLKRQSPFLSGTVLRAAALCSVFGLASMQGFAEQTAPQATMTRRSDAEAERRLEAQTRLTRAQALLGLGRTDEARAEVRAVLAGDAINLDALRMLAAIEEAVGRNEDARRVWTTVYRLSGDSAAAERIRALTSVSASYLEAQGVYFGSPDAGDTNVGARIDAIGMIEGFRGFSAGLEVRSIDKDSLVRLDGTTAASRKSAERLDLEYSQSLTSSLSLGGQANLTGDGAGGRVFLRGRTKTSTLEVSLGERQPYWLFAEGVANDARESHAGVSGTASLGWVQARGSVKKVRYDAGGYKEVAEGARTTVGLDVFNPEAVRPVRFAYVLDAETVSSRKDPVDAAGRSYRPLPVEPREVHSVGVYKAVQVSPGVSLDLGGGYRSDRLGEKGPFASLNAALKISDTVEAGALVEYSKPSIRGSGAAGDYVYGRLVLRKRY